MTRTRTRVSPPDQACVAAVDLARAAAEELARPGEVGEHLGLRGRGRPHRHPLLRLPRPGLPRLALGRHRDPRLPGEERHGERGRPAARRGRAARARVGAVERAAAPRRPRRRRPAADLGGRRPAGAGFRRDRRRDRPSDDFRVRPGPGPGALGHRQRPRCQTLALRRHGPHTPIAHAAPAQCSTCGFYWPLAGALRQVFGVCANEYAPDDGKVVAADHGCGAHSEAAVDAAGRSSRPCPSSTTWAST